MAGASQSRSVRPARRAAVGLAGLLCLAATVPVAIAGEFSATVTATTEYIYLGQSLSGGNPALQAGIDYEHASGLFTGAWASTIDIANLGGRRDLELVYYLGYGFSPATALDVSATVLRYTYPGQSTYFDYDYTELVVSATVFDRHSLEAGFSDDVYGYGADGRYAELRSDWDLRSAWVFSAGFGYNMLEDQGTSNYWYGDVGVSARLGRFMFDIRYYDNETPTGILAYLSAGSELVLSVSAAF